MIRQSPLTGTVRSPRSGATLVEVLMALLIMAVGVTSVFTLFPLSIIKAVKANQLTNSKLYEGAIKDTLLAQPQLWTGAPVWTENTTYGRTLTTSLLQDRWVTPRPNGRLLPDTNEVFFYGGATSELSGSIPPNLQVRRDWNASLNAGGYQNYFSAAPTWMRTASDENLTWTPYRHSPFLANRLWSSYLVDPLGWYSANSAADQIQFGRVVSGDTSGASVYMDRIHCHLSSLAASQSFQLPDSWTMSTESTAVVVSVPAANRLQIAFPDTMDITQQGQLDRIRVVLTSTLSERVYVLPVRESVFVPAPTYPSVPGYSVLEINGTLPAGYVADVARIEVQSPSRYSWLMSVHSGPRGEFNAECAVVFNRSFETVDEQGYRAEFAQTEDLDGDGTLDPGEDDMWPNGRIDSNIAKVRWPYDPNSDPPRIKEGGYIFDANYGYWYQIQKIPKDVEKQRVDAADMPDPNGAFVRTIMSLGSQVNFGTGAVSAGTAYFTDYLVNANGTDIDAQAVLMPGVVHVFTETPESPR